MFRIFDYHYIILNQKKMSDQPNSLILFTSIFTIFDLGIKALSYAYNYAVNKCHDIFYYKQVITNKNKSLINAIRIDLENLIDKYLLTNIKETGIDVQRHLPNGTYSLKLVDVGDIKVTIAEQSITLYVYKGCYNYDLDICDKLNVYIDNIKKNNCSPMASYMIYLSNGNKWDFPFQKNYTPFLEKNYTEEMKETLRDIDIFMSQQTYYNINYGTEHRKGYLLYGISGSGKTEVFRLISKKYNMSLYLIDLNSSGLDNNGLKSLTGSVRPNSIILFDEIDKQLHNLKHNRKNKCGVTFDGLLSALNGPVPLENRIIIGMTANEIDIIKNTENGTLLQSGRINYIKRFITKIDLGI